MAKSPAQLSAPKTKDYRRIRLLDELIHSVQQLAPRRDPYWQRIQVGFYLGYRKLHADGAGTWVARFQDPATGNQRWVAPDPIASITVDVPTPEADFRAVAEVLCVLPCPPDVLTRLKVGDFDPATGTLLIQDTGAPTSRRVPLPVHTAALLRKQANSRAAGEPLFPSQERKAWATSSFKRRVANTAKAAGLATGEQIPALRHAAITDLIQAGTSVTSAVYR